MTSTDPETLTLREFAGFLSVHYLTARQYIIDGLVDGAYRLPSGYVRIPLAAAEKFKATLQIKPTSAKPDKKQNRQRKR